MPDAGEASVVAAGPDSQRRKPSALVVNGLSKTFGPARVLADLSFAVSAGQVHGLLGGNGSGKSTLIKILAGVYHGDPGGTLRMLGHEVASNETSPELARRAGLRFVHQTPGVFQEMTVAENLAMGVGFPTRAGRIRWKALRRHAQGLLDRFEIDARPDDSLGDLRPADQTMVAIARALRGQDDGGELLLVLDEPTEALPEHEVELLLDALRRYARQGQTILYVSHRLDEVLATVDTVTVLRDGQLVATRPAHGLAKSQLVEDIVGQPLRGVFAEPSSPVRPAGAPLIETSGLSGGPLRGVDLEVRRGEVVGIAGLLGAGRTELLRMLFGAHRRERGEIRVDGSLVDIATPAQALGMGIAYVGENRELDGLFPSMIVRENLSAGLAGRYWRGGRFRHRAESADAERDIAAYSIKGAGQRAPVATLSGGNQQKVILARSMRRDPALLLLDEPTHGVDVGARADVYAAIRHHVERGMAAILVASDFEELAHASDRVYVLRQGRVCAELSGSDLSSSRLLELVHADDPDLV